MCRQWQSNTLGHVTIFNTQSAMSRSTEEIDVGNPEVDAY
eukprot:CAMPEP_0183315566 /NCGR_PEP_ID=MMETSP0160_2-20130417/52223_1 /TAXON_ID=2839 ORGANISM="Odontella Sinensis, Strain Grunow 1884" /NCGR_SAMPLE_ID=MMETSP0160_2 /ASSEMBLY_ACC=CAM_ASM_000250 /LENGTH=39 /DNA_ID= /DNA_START= /DNA_END= /DNA_ORIENTATION=